MKYRKQNRRSTAGVTLIELMLTIALIGIMTFAVTNAFIAGIQTEKIYERRDQQASHIDVVERHITQELQGAILSDSSATTKDVNCYFVGETGNNGTSTGNGGTATANLSAGNSSSAPSGGLTGATGDLGCDRITFTTTEPGVPQATQDNSTDDFEAQHQKNGPIGGTMEVSLSTTAVGDPSGKTGLFERTQRPSDADATQGGTEKLLSAEVSSIGFQFWDGTEWVEAWDSTSTTNGDAGHLPAAVLVRYILVGDPAQIVHSLLVWIPSSDVNVNNPIVTTGTTAT